jgi:hypothetical protein
MQYHVRYPYPKYRAAVTEDPQSTMRLGQKVQHALAIEPHTVFPPRTFIKTVWAPKKCKFEAHGSMVGAIKSLGPSMTLQLTTWDVSRWLRSTHEWLPLVELKAICKSVNYLKPFEHLSRVKGFVDSRPRAEQTLSNKADTPNLALLNGPCLAIVPCSARKGNVLCQFPGTDVWVVATCIANIPAGDQVISCLTIPGGWRTLNASIRTRELDKRWVRTRYVSLQPGSLVGRGILMKHNSSGQEKKKSEFRSNDVFEFKIPL